MLGIYLPVYQNELAPSEKVMLITSNSERIKNAATVFSTLFYVKNIYT